MAPDWKRPRRRWIPAQTLRTNKHRLNRANLPGGCCFAHPLGTDKSRYRHNQNIPINHHVLLGPAPRVVRYPSGVESRTNPAPPTNSRASIFPDLRRTWTKSAGRKQVSAICNPKTWGPLSRGPLSRVLKWLRRYDRDYGLQPSPRSPVRLLFEMI